MTTGIVSIPTPDYFHFRYKIPVDIAPHSTYIEYIERNNATMQQKETIMTDLNASTSPAKTARAAKPVKTISVAQLARELKIDEKIARRRMRANVARTKPAKTPAVVKNTSRKNARYEYADTAENRAMLTAIIKTPE